MDDMYLYQKKILLVDDEEDLLNLIALILKDNGFKQILTALNAKQALTLCHNETPDLLVLDVMLPDGDGFSLFKQIRQINDAPVIFLTARDEAVDRIAGLGLGADDYIAKPFMPQELVLRILAVLRRCYHQVSPIIHLKNADIYFDRAEVCRGDQIFSLTAKEYAFLKLLSQNLGRIVSVDAICEALWGDNPWGYENSLNAHVRRIREKIEADPSHPESLITVRGLGYKLIKG